MIKVDVWQDKLPEDKAKFYNRTRMSIEFFASKLELPHDYILEDLKRHGYVYSAEKREISKVSNVGAIPNMGVVATAEYQRRLAPKPKLHVPH